MPLRLSSLRALAGLLARDRPGRVVHFGARARRRACPPTCSRCLPSAPLLWVALAAARSGRRGRGDRRARRRRAGPRRVRARRAVRRWLDGRCPGRPARRRLAGGALAGSRCAGRRRPRGRARRAAVRARLALRRASPPAPAPAGDGPRRRPGIGRADRGPGLRALVDTGPPRAASSGPAAARLTSLDALLLSHDSSTTTAAPRDRRALQVALLVRRRCPGQSEVAAPSPRRAPAGTRVLGGRGGQRAAQRPGRAAGGGPLQRHARRRCRTTPRWSCWRGRGACSLPAAGRRRVALLLGDRLGPVAVLDVSHHGSAEPGARPAARAAPAEAGGDLGRRAQQLRPSRAARRSLPRSGRRAGAPHRPRRRGRARLRACRRARG